MRKAFVHALLWAGLMGMARGASACAVCFGDPSSALTKGMNNGILVLLGVVGLVQCGFVALFWTLWRRARRHRLAQGDLGLADGGSRR